MQDILAGKHLVPRPHRHRDRRIASDKDGVAPDRVYWLAIDLYDLKWIDVNVIGMVAVLR